MSNVCYDYRQANGNHPSNSFKKEMEKTIPEANANDAFKSRDQKSAILVGR